MSSQVSRYGGSAWTFDEQRRYYYYHYYHMSMPDLNHREANVREEFRVRVSCRAFKSQLPNSFVFFAVHTLILLLNLCCRQDIFRFWLDKGVDALQVEGVHVMFETDDVQMDEPVIERDDVLPVGLTPESLFHVFDFDIWYLYGRLNVVKIGLLVNLKAVGFYETCS